MRTQQIREQKKDTVRVLPVFEGYTVDERLAEFRKLACGRVAEFVPFASVKGRRLLARYRKQSHGQWCDLDRCDHVVEGIRYFAGYIVCEDLGYFVRRRGRGVELVKFSSGKGQGLLRRYRRVFAENRAVA